MNDNSKKALVAMSGGVDSSVAAYMMQSLFHYDCIGVTMKLFENKDIGIPAEQACLTLDDIEDAKAVAEKLGIPHHVFNFTDGFKEKVIEPFICAYENGMTPNPCIECNRYLKFEKLFQRAKELDCDYVVTGHYAVTEYNHDTGRYELKKAADSSKDQSYVLYSLTQEQLAHVKFPLGAFTKDKIRELAKSFELDIADKKDSQDICFVQDGKYTDFIRNYTGRTYPSGDFVGPDGDVLGNHNGIISYTIGQRKGLGLSLKEPLYVKEVNPETNKVFLCRDNDLYSTELDADNINLISVAHINEPMRVKAKVRYRHTEDFATAVQTSDNTIHVTFDIPQRAITKGQAVVLYDGDTVVGGGRIIDAR